MKGACLTMNWIGGGGKVKPDLVTFNVLFNGFCKVGMQKEAFVYMALMWKCHVANVVTYSIFIDMFCKMGDFDMGDRKSVV